MSKDLGQDAQSTKQDESAIDPAKLAGLPYPVKLTIGEYDFKPLGVRKLTRLISEGFNLLHLLSAMDTSSDQDTVETIAQFLTNDQVFEFVKKFVYQSIGEKEDKFGDDIQLSDISEIIVACRFTYDVAAIKKNFTLAGIKAPQALLDFLSPDQQDQPTA